ncbi:hypothetical protein [Stenotrophomonas phage vB_SmeS_BUCT709]|nr:hypothetical protein [Stenotrophomonas phage vB_SmeS_BUCT709]
MFTNRVKAVNTRLPITPMAAHCPGVYESSRRVNQNVALVVDVPKAITSETLCVIFIVPYLPAGMAELKQAGPIVIRMV